MFKYLLFLILGKVATTESIVAPLKNTLKKLEDAAKLRAEQIIKNNNKISELKNKNEAHNVEIEHADRVAKKLGELLQ
jgi:hypothetical protein